MIKKNVFLSNQFFYNCRKKNGWQCKLILLFCFLLFVSISCTKNKQNIDSYQNISNISTNYTTTNLETNSITATQGFLPKINIDDGYFITYIEDINLDFDAEDEQVIVAANRDDKNIVKVYVADFDSVRNRYIKTWEIEKKEINYKTVLLSYIDVIGDHSSEIIFNAVTVKNNQHIDVFRKTHSSDGLNLYYESICNLTVAGQIELQNKERSQAYNLGQRNGVSFPIVTYEEVTTASAGTAGNSLSSNVNKITYMWNYQANKYINAFKETIPLKTFEEEKMNKLFFETLDGYKSFLDGQWYNVDNGNFVIRFDVKNNEISFYTSDIMETYSWLSSNYSSFGKTINISARNDLIHFITKRFIIQIQKMNRIQIEIRDTENPRDVDQLNGYYERISENVVSKLYNQKNNTSENMTLSGEFAGAADSIIFENNNFLFKPDNSKHGLFSLYKYNNDNILELRFLDENYLQKEKRVYKIEYKESSTQNSKTVQLTLTKGNITANSFMFSGENPIYYVQAQPLAE